MLEVQLGFCNNHTAQAQQSNQVRNSHQTVNNIGNNPDHFQLQEYAQTYQNDITDTVRHDAFYAEEIFCATLAVIAPADNSGEGEEYQTAGQDILGNSRESRSESSLSQCSTVQVAGPGAADDDGQAGHGADDDGIDKGTGHRNKALFCRPFGFRCSCYDRSRAQTGFVGINAAGDTTAHCQHNSGTGKAACCRSTVEGTVDNQLNCCRQSIGIKYQHRNGCDNINSSHERNNLACYVSNGLQTADNNNSNKNSQDCCYNVFGNAEGYINNRSDCIYLSKGTAAQAGSHNTEDREHYSQGLEFFAQALFNVVHRTAGSVAVFIIGTILNSQHAFGIFGCHTEESSQPHPQQSTGTTELNCRCYANDITGADSCGQSSAQSLKAAYITFALAAGGKNQLQGFRQLHNLKQAKTDAH